MSSQAEANSNATTYKPLDRAARKKCWAARDKFFEALDEKAIVDPADPQVRQNESLVEKEKAFKEACPLSWFDHFSRLRVQEAKINEYKTLMNNPKFK
ncbi:hypothetical protein K493DRAFT_312605 [Basidiobolus meristosporus CBS 931.73]|uniref:Cytochrome c oxidase, subunit VIb n=1 Tax=Basidiobolus meristosporus CBS 931.73 TaxID=1314790 RepID=A0A1Y1X0H8_9FUNG|nr:hypothetical protein K493DRAFT_321085 [Basidiobolus meristosporus CBS 931.73]ORY01009.1 hypothetical protein K493DRAFT_312605 [Basidiobolus meristosporus CBS 931.73]|eukprot:ORX79165.1 hypothetical protein K493DRAFT_321085 [Basidiobolus meristosporus CBS 931.73]